MPAPARPERSGLIAAIISLFLASLLVSAGAMWNRHAAERAANRIILAVDGIEVARTAARSGMPVQEFLTLLRSAGVTAVGVHEYTLQDAIDDGRAFLLTQSALEALWPSSVRGGVDGAMGPGAALSGAAPDYLGLDADAAPPWFVEAVERSFEASSRFYTENGRITLWALPPERPPAAISLGFDPELLENVAALGLDVIPRLRPALGRPWDAARRTIEQIPPGSAAAVVFWGAQVTGFPDHVSEAASAFAALGAPLGVIEFAEQKGLDALLRALDYRAVRVHSITQEEMAAGIPRDVALRRWERAARERGVRLAYVRLYPDAPAGDAAAYLRAVAERLVAAGFTLGRPLEPPGPLGSSTLWTVLAGALVSAGAGLWLLGAMFPRRAGRGGPAVAALAALAVAAAVALAWLNGYTVPARQMLAGITAVVFPSLAVVTALKAAQAAGRRPPGAGAAAAAVRAVAAGFAASAAVTLSGAMLVALFMDDVRFFLKIEEFRGVKVAYAAPLVVVSVYLWLEWRRGNGDWNWTEGAGSLWGFVKALLAARLQVWHVLLSAGAAGVLLVYLLRSGNDGLPVLGVEAALRALLEDALVARPRTKEFLAGHPALLGALALAARSDRARKDLQLLAAGLAVLGTVGPVSIINTFAHAHSPLALSVLRTLYGMMLGVVPGAAAVAVALALTRSREGRIGGGVLRRRRGTRPDAGRPTSSMRR